MLEWCVKHDDEGPLTISGDGDDWCVVSVRTVCEIHDDVGPLTISSDGDDWCVVSVRTVCET